MKKAIFVTGAGRGIGREIAIKLSSEGYLVYGCSRTESELQETKRLSCGLIHISPLNVVRKFTQLLVQKKLPGRIVLLSGGGATKPIPNFSSYACAKSAVVRFGETLAKELEQLKITLNS